MRIRKRFILFAAVDIGYRIELYSNFITKYYGDRLVPESFSKYVLPKEHYKTDYTYKCEIYKKPKWYVYLYLFLFFVYSLFKYDIFHFFSGETILTRKLRRYELRIYKLLGKTIIFHFVGADIRSSRYIQWKNNHLRDFLDNKAEGFPPISEDWQLELINDAKRYANTIIVSTPDLLKIIPEAHYLPVLIDLEKFVAELSSVRRDRTNNKAIKILHVPSNSSLKGSKVIMEVLSLVKEKLQGQVEILLPGFENWDKIYPITRYDLISYLKESNFLIDQLTIGWYGLQSIEALIAGNKVFCYIEKECEKYLFPDTPIINVNANTLEEILLEQCSEYDFASENAKVIEWVKKYHTIENNNDVLLKAWKIQ